MRVVGVGRFFITPLQLGNDALVGGGVAALVAFGIAIAQGNLVAGLAAVQNDIALLGAERAHRYMQRQLVMVGYGGHQLSIVAIFLAVH